MPVKGYSVDLLIMTFASAGVSSLYVLLSCDDATFSIAIINNDVIISLKNIFMASRFI
jgi:hypothetical protein